MFARKYKRLAASFDDCIFLEVTGDENNALRVSSLISRPTNTHRS